MKNKIYCLLITLLSCASMEAQALEHEVDSLVSDKWYKISTINYGGAEVEGYVQLRFLTGVERKALSPRIPAGKLIVPKYLKEDE